MLWWRVTEKGGAEFYVNLGEVTHILLPNEETPGGSIAFTNGGFLHLKEQEDRLQLIEDVVLQSSKVDRHQIKTVTSSETVRIIHPYERSDLGGGQRPMNVRVEELDRIFFYLRGLKIRLRAKRRALLRGLRKLGRLKPWR